jgi:mono/diheme cytochrome c family protein
MKKITLMLIGVLSLLFFACGNTDKNTDDQSEEVLAFEDKTVDPYDNWKENNGVGPVASFELPAEIDEALVAKGSEVYESKCTACHKTDKKFIGPAPKDILSRRNPAWVMNMILAPDKMVMEDPIAKKLLMEFNGSPMANQNLTQEEARAVLEYFRTL